MTEVRFVYGRPLYGGEFLGRKQELRQVVGRVRTQQNTLVLGSPRIGKSSFLSYLEKPEAAGYWGEGYERLIFRYLDEDMLLRLPTQTAFWSQVLENPAVERGFSQTGAFKKARENGFGMFVLEVLFKALHHEGKDLVLLLDGFDRFLAHPILHNAEFYGSLRSLSSRFPSLTLVVASRLPIAALNRETQSMAPHGSPYFNVFTEYELGPLAGREVAQLLAPFTAEERKLVVALGGNHPYLTQLGAGLLWENRQGKLPSAKLYQKVADEAYKRARQHYEGCWQVWTEGEKKALTAVVLSHIPQLIPNQTPHLPALEPMIDDYTPELEKLIPSGIVTYDPLYGWRIPQELFVWWLADDLLTRLRDKEPFDNWLQKQMLDGVLTYQEKELFSQAAKGVGNLLGKGVNTLIEAYTKQLLQA
jgi:hypothetical protein